MCQRDNCPYRPKPTTIAVVANVAKSIFHNTYAQYALGAVGAFAFMRLAIHLDNSKQCNYNNYADTDYIDQTHGSQLTSVGTFIKGTLYSLAYPFSKWIKKGGEYLTQKKSTCSDCNQADKKHNKKV